MRYVENDEDKISDEEFDEEDDNYSDLNELFRENCKLRLLVNNQNVMSKKLKAKKGSYIYYTSYSFT